MLQLLALLFEVTAVWCFFAAVGYTEACIVQATLVFFLTNLECATARGHSAVLRRKALPAIWLAAFLFCTLRFIPKSVSWPPIVAFSVLGVVCTGATIMWYTAQELRYMEIYIRILGTSALISYTSDIHPRPDDQIDIEYYAWIKALAIFFLVASTLCFVLTYALVASRIQDSKYGVINNDDDDDDDDDKIQYNINPI